MRGLACFSFIFENDDHAIVFVSDFLFRDLFPNISTFLSLGLERLSGELEMLGGVDCNEVNVPAIAPVATFPTGKMPLMEGIKNNPGVVVVVESAVSTLVGGR